MFRALITGKLFSSENLVGLLVLSLSALLFVLALDLPQRRGDPGGNALWPQLMALGAGTGAIGILLRNARETFAFRHHTHSRQVPVHANDSGINGLDRPVSPYLVMASCIVYALAIPLIGLPLSTIFLVSAIMFLLHATIREVLVFSVSVSAFLYIFFVYLLGASVPSGRWIDLV